MYYFVVALFLTDLTVNPFTDAANYLSSSYPFETYEECEEFMKSSPAVEMLEYMKGGIYGCIYSPETLELNEWDSDGS
jgi:hypothetical protein